MTVKECIAELIVSVDTYDKQFPERHPRNAFVIHHLTEALDMLNMTSSKESVGEVVLCLNLKSQ